jgi:chitinase
LFYFFFISPTVVKSEERGEWQLYTAYNVGDVVSYQRQLFKCLEAHTSLPGWEPPNVPALRKLVN